MKTNYKDYLVITLHDNDFHSELRSVAVLLSHMITYEGILENNKIDLEVLRCFIINSIAKSYEITTYKKSGYSHPNNILAYFEKELKIYCVNKEDVVTDNSELLYLCVNENMREFGEYFII